jgi:hypothetical protein
MSAQQDIATFLMGHGHQPFCAQCLAKVVKARTVPLVERAMKELATDPGYRVEEVECSRCDRTALNIRALWMGM